MRIRQLGRPKVLGVDPHLVLVIELGARVDPDEFRIAGLRVLDSADRSIVVAFADDPQLGGFMDRLDKCAAGIPPGQKAEPYQSFVDAIDRVRSLAPADRITADLRVAIANQPPASEIRLDVELWHPDDDDRALQWVADLRRAVGEIGGRVADIYVNHASGVILNRVYVRAGDIEALAELDVIARIDVLPRPSLTLPQFWQATPDHLPATVSPLAGSPIVGLVDSGVASAHPLVGPAVLAADSLSASIPDGEDRCGHGTMIAGLILHGPVDAAVARGRTLRPFCRLVSVAVLDHNNQFPDSELWERDLVDAIEWCASQGASVINLSLGDSRRPFPGRRQMQAAALVDDIARRLDLVVVVSAGNTRPIEYLPEVSETTVRDYPLDLLTDARSGILDPGTAALALTVGGLTDAHAATGYSTRESVMRRSLGRPGWPSPVTRRGPGIANSVKPEVVERAGTLGIESNRLVDNDPELGVISTMLATGRLLGSGLGTSMATPLVTRTAAAIKARFPDFTANLTRALVLLSAEPTGFSADLEPAARPSARATADRRLMGYGRPSIDRAIESTSHRVVLVAEESIPIDSVHVYELPMPTSFTTTGGTRGIDVALAFNPRTRASRLDYLASKMEVVLFRGLPLDTVLGHVAKAGDADNLETALSETDDPDDTPTEKAPEHPVRRSLGTKIVQLALSSPFRSAGANQLGRVVFRQRLDRQKHAPMFLVVRNTNHWDDDTAAQPYALAVALWRSPGQPEVYAEVRAEFEAIIEVPVEVRLGI